MFKIPGKPSPRATVCELADFMELWAWQNNQVSCTDVLRFLGRVDDNDHNIGCEDDDSENAELVDEVLIELERREKACSGGYPFTLSGTGTMLRHSDSADAGAAVYRYLLLSTRLNMRDSKTHAKLDGTKLMELLCAQVLKNYLGEHSQAFVFGTAAGSTFKDQINALCKRLGEGVGFRTIDLGAVTAQDDKLDAVAWIPFRDGRSSQLILFAQCKTGTNWTEMVSQLQPRAFTERWMKRQPAVEPTRVFCAAEVQDPTEWEGVALYAGILFDRCRITAFSHGVDNSDLIPWTTAAIKSFKIVT